MRRSRNKKSQSLLLVGVWVNRNWILGNWIKEIKLRSQGAAQIHWTFSVFARKHFWEKFVKFPLPKYGAYFFSYPSMFESYLKSNPVRYRHRSIVNYTHNMEELGDLKHQALILNQAYSVHFNCSANAVSLIEAGLDPIKVRLVFGAVDSDCIPIGSVKKERKTILLASKYSERKGLDIFPEVVDKLPDWKFIILGRGWEKFLKEKNLDNNPNIEYHFPQNAQGQRKSTAFGMFGLTAPAYADIQQANAKFANRPITSLTPEEQTQAYQTYTDLNKQRLQGMGVEPTDANARLAHFLGASGAAKYLQTGEISPQAAAANGGLENAIRIAEQRLAGGQAPASGAAQQPAAQPLGAGREHVGWKIVDGQGNELYSFSGAGNSQSDANRIAMQWINQQRDQGRAFNNIRELEVVPVWREA